MHVLFSLSTAFFCHPHLFHAFLAKNASASAVSVFYVLFLLRQPCILVTSSDSSDDNVDGSDMSWAGPHIRAEEHISDAEVPGKPAGEGHILVLEPHKPAEEGHIRVPQPDKDDKHSLLPTG